MAFEQTPSQTVGPYFAYGLTGTQYGYDLRSLFGPELVRADAPGRHIRIVVEDRRSAIAAVLAGARFVRRQAAGVLGLYGLNAVAFLLLISVYALVAPGAPRSGVSMWAAFVLGELYIVGRHYLKLLFYASETAFFQGALAHAAYTAAPAPVWPDSPAAEMIANADRTVTS